MQLKDLARYTEAAKITTQENLRVMIEIPTGEWLEIERAAIRRHNGERVLVLKPDCRI